MSRLGIGQVECFRPDDNVVLDRRVRRVVERLAAAPHLEACSLAGEQNLSVSWLGQLFKTHTGESLHTFIIHRRMIHAARLLRTTELRIKEIAACVGYAQTPSFDRIFSRVHGQSPQAFRRAAHQCAAPPAGLPLMAFRLPSPVLCPLCMSCGAFALVAEVFPRPNAKEANEK